MERECALIEPFLPRQRSIGRPRTTGRRSKDGDSDIRAGFLASSHHESDPHPFGILEASVRSRGFKGTTGLDRDLIEAGLNEAAGGLTGYGLWLQCLVRDAGPEGPHGRWVVVLERIKAVPEGWAGSGSGLRCLQRAAHAL
jgi:hypothetical protein